MSSPRQTYKDLPNLDVLRTMAVSQVFFAHLLTAFGVTMRGFRYDFFGDLGVAMFFVHTSLVLMWSMERNPDPLGFYVRRAFRIYPLAMVVVLVVVGFHIHVGVDPVHFYSGITSKRQLLTNLLLIQNLAHQPNVMGPLWTLPVEIQMYVLLPFLFFFVRQNLKLWPLIMLWVAVFVQVMSHGVFDPNYLIVVIPLFLPGVIAYAGFGRLRPIFPGWLMPVVLLALDSLASLHQSLVFGKSGFIVKTGFALILGLILPLFRQLEFRPFHGVFFQIAKYSYGIYLMHPFGILLCVYTLHDYSLTVRLGALIGLMIVTVIAAYHLIEKPAIDLGRKIAVRIARSDGFAVADA